LLLTLSKKAFPACKLLRRLRMLPWIDGTVVLSLAASDALRKPPEMVGENAWQKVRGARVMKRSSSQPTGFPPCHTNRCIPSQVRRFPMTCFNIKL
jgi:hypothetical protein